MLVFLFSLSNWTNAVVSAATRANISIRVDILPKRMVLGVLLLEVHLGREAVRLPFYFHADMTIRCNPTDTKGMSERFAGG